jgi:PAS domain S-box-containing protein
MQTSTLQPKRIALLISSLYCTFGILWIMLSDSLNYEERSNVTAVALRRELFVEAIFIISSAILIFFLIYRSNKKYTLSLKAQFKDQQEILEKNEKLFRAIIENTEDIISLIDKDGNIIHVNPALEKLTGFTLDEIKGKPAFMVMHPDNIEESKAVLKKLVNNPSVVYDRTNRFINKRTGGYIWVQGTIVNLLNDKNVGAIISNYRDVTVKKIMEQRNTFNHNNLKALINNTNDLMWSVDKEFKLITANKAFNDAIAYLSGKNIVQGDNVLETNFDEGKLARFKMYYESAFEGEAFTVIEHNVKPTETWSEVSFYPIFNENVIAGTACFVKNITENRKAMNALHELTTRHLMATDSAKIGTWDYDLINNKLVWDNIMYEIFKVDREEFSGAYDAWSTMVHPDDIADAETELQKAITGIKDFNTTFRIVWKSGEVRYIQAHAHALKDVNGKTLRMIGVNWDITNQKITEERLNAINKQLIDNEFKLKQAQAIAHVGSWEINFANEITIWSEETCKIYGVSPKENEHPYEVWRSFIHPEDFKRVLKIIKESHDTLSPPYFHYRIIRKDGSIKYIYSKMQFEFNAEGNATGLYGVTYDVTEQKLAEQEILQKNEELRSLSNYLQNVREEERAAIAREIHDELGQQLTVLKMDIGWVLRKQNNADEAVVSRIEEMLRFSDELIIKVRKISADLRPAIIDDLGLVAALEWICDDFEKKTGTPCNFTSHIKERKFEENFSITAYRILQESLTNIIRHAEAKLVTVLVTENEKEWFLEVTDNGKGVSAERIKNGKTLGVLGMRERAALLGGELVIEGIKNKGTNVILKLPLKN